MTQTRLSRKRQFPNMTAIGSDKGLIYIYILTAASCRERFLTETYAFYKSSWWFTPRAGVFFIINSPSNLCDWQVSGACGLVRAPTGRGYWVIATTTIGMVKAKLAIRPWCFLSLMDQRRSTFLRRKASVGHRDRSAYLSSVTGRAKTLQSGHW